MNTSAAAREVGDWQLSNRRHWDSHEDGRSPAGAVRSGRDQARPDADLRRERPVHRASIRHLQESRALLFGQRAAQGNLPLDTIQHAFLRLALGAVDGVDLRMFELYRDTLER